MAQGATRGRDIIPRCFATLCGQFASAFSLLAQAILVMLLFFAKIGNQRSGEDEHCFFFMNLPPFPLCCRFFAIVYHIFSLVSMCGIADRICAAEKMLDKGRAGQYNKRWISMVVAH